MNFFKHHIGDYASATDHLTWDEDMAYTRLMRVYYRDEKPLPQDERQVYRLARAQSRSQRAAIDTVLKEFFSKQTDGWHNKRCDEEIVASRAFIDSQRTAAAKRWQSNGNASAMPPHRSGMTVAIPPNPNPNPNPNPKPTPTPDPEGGGIVKYGTGPGRKRFRTADEIEAEEIDNARREGRSANI